MAKELLEEKSNEWWNILEYWEQEELLKKWILREYKRRRKIKIVPIV